MLVTLGFVALLVGVVLVVCGYTVAPAALRPGWGAVILGVVLILIGYLLPSIATNDVDYDGLAATSTDLVSTSNP